MQILIEKLRQKYMKTPPPGMSKKDIQKVSESDLLDMDYFLSEGEEKDMDDDFGEEGF